MVIEQAGDRASTGCARVLDVPVESPHQQVPLAIGSREDVLGYEETLRAVAGSS